MSSNFIHTFKSPNYDERPKTISGDPIIDTVVLHYTGTESAAASIKRLCDKAAKVSSHYLIDYDGSIYQLVADDKRAWHAGVSRLGSRENVNHFSIGIEIQNKGLPETGKTQLEPYTQAQYQALIALLGYIYSKHPIKWLVGHSCVAPDRKIDPGPHFSWQILKSAGYPQKLPDNHP